MIDQANLVLAGVGGQGVISLAQLLSLLAADNRLYVKQSEVHGMAQRGGSVSSHVRFSKKPVASAIIAEEDADFILGAEPLESLRNLEFLRKEGVVISSINTLENPHQIPDYPKLEYILQDIRERKHVLIDSLSLAKKAGNPKTESMVLMGALAPFLKIDPAEIERYIHLAFDRKGEAVVQANLQALELGMRENAFYQIEQILQRVKQEGRETLLEPETYQVLTLLEIQMPRHHFIKAEEIQKRNLEEILSGVLGQFTSEKIVIKIVSADISHKQDVGGVIFVERNSRVVSEKVQSLFNNLKLKSPQADLRGVLITEFVAHSPEFGHELLIGIKQDAALGPVVTFGAGGTLTEFYAQRFENQVSAIRSTFNLNREQILKMLQDTALADLLFGRARAKEPLISEETVVDYIEKFSGLAEHFSESGLCSDVVITQAEVNPFAVVKGQLIALDARLQFAVKKNFTQSRPVSKIKHLLYPQSVLLAGASAEKLNPGRVILHNLLEGGQIPKDKIFLLHKSAQQIDECQAFASLDKTPQVDLAVLSLEAQAAGEILKQIVEKRKAQAVILIPGGFGETEAGRKLEEELRELIARSHQDSDGGVIVNGGNCLGILSPFYNSFFIAKYKLPLIETRFLSLASLSQSGAYLVSQISNLQGAILPRYAVSIGNQIDLTVSDYLEFLQDDPKIKVFSIYLEGFQPQDGRRFLQVAQKVIQNGKRVIFYKAGRTQLGEQAAFSHTAAIAGEYRTLVAALRQVGVKVGQNLEEFEDLTKLSVFWSDEKITGNRVGIVSNAGFECTVSADNLQNLKLAGLSPATYQNLRQLLPPGIVDLHHPIDATPITNSGNFAGIVKALLDDPEVNLVLASPLPPTQALENLAPGTDHPEDIYRPESLPSRLIELNRQYCKPILACIDAGPLYDPCVRLLESNGIPCLRKIDRAAKALSLFVS